MSELFNDLKESLNEAVLVAKGEIAPAKIRKRHLVVKPNRRLTPDEIQATRSQLELSQALFASVLGVSVETVSKWEQGRNQPAGAALRLIHLLKQRPTLISLFISKD